ncbi:MAG: TonB family protein [Nibricoccus sp.]
MCDDAELLRCYAAERSEEAFAELVRRHIGLVYQAAARQLGGDTHLAQDVAQAVFTDLARKAGSLQGHRVLAGWLYTSTRYAAAQVVRAEQRRRKREAEAHRMNEIFSEKEGGGAPEWERLRPVIDEALHGLAERDREAVLLRFFEGRPFAEIGRALTISEDGARMRVDRALEKLRGALLKRGVASTTAALGMILANPALATAPVGMASQIAGAALTGTAAAGGVGVVVTFMGMTKLQIGLAGVIVAGGAAGLWVQQQADAALRAERARLEQGALDLEKTKSERVERVRVAAAVRELRKDDIEFARLEADAWQLRRELAANVAARERLQKPPGETTDGKRIFKLSELDVAPKAVTRKPPKYPADMRSSGIEGVVNVRFLVGEDGTVKGAEAVKSSHEMFADAAVEAVKGWVFEPGLKAAVPVNVQMTVPIVYSLRKEDGDANDWF